MADSKLPTYAELCKAADKELTWGEVVEELAVLLKRRPSYDEVEQVTGAPPYDPTEYLAASGLEFSLPECPHCGKGPVPLDQVTPLEGVPGYDVAGECPYCQERVELPGSTPAELSLALGERRKKLAELDPIRELRKRPWVHSNPEGPPDPEYDHTATPLNQWPDGTVTCTCGELLAEPASRWVHAEASDEHGTHVPSPVEGTQDWDAYPETATCTCGKPIELRPYDQEEVPSG